MLRMLQATVSYITDWNKQLKSKFVRIIKLMCIVYSTKSDLDGSTFVWNIEYIHIKCLSDTGICILLGVLIYLCKHGLLLLSISSQNITGSHGNATLPQHLIEVLHCTQELFTLLVTHNIKCKMQYFFLTTHVKMDTGHILLPQFHLFYTRCLTCC